MGVGAVVWGGNCVGVDAWEEGCRCEREVAVVGQTKLMLLLRNLVIFQRKKRERAFRDP